MTPPSHNTHREGIDRFASLIYPLSKEAYFADFYGKKPFLSPAQTEREPMLTIEDIFDRMRCLDLKYGLNFSLARNGEALPALFKESLRASSKQIPLMLKNGWTLVFNAIDEGFLLLQQLAESIASSVNSDVNINVYLSPVGTQGFGYHTDKHEVFILQLSGRKIWKVHHLNEHEGSDQPAVDDILNPGQVLYIPEGCRHTGIACDDADSLHVTIGFSSRSKQTSRYLRRSLETWLSSESGNLCLGKLARPHQLPVGQKKLTEQETEHILKAFGNFLDLDLSSDQTESPHPKEPDEVFVEPLTYLDLQKAFIVSSKFQIAPSTEEASIVCQLPVGTLSFKAQFLEALRYVQQSKHFRVTDLPVSREDGIALCRVLHGAGVLMTDQS